MSRLTWVRLDNASNIFLAAMSAHDTKVFRFSAEVTEDVDPDLLQQALDHVYDQYPLYHAVLRRGVFWYYLERSDLRPDVVPDVLPPCAPLYHFDRRELLFRVAHHRNRIILEVFHALSDATGALWLFGDLVAEYVLLRHPDAFPDAVGRQHGLVKHALESDSYVHHFGSGGTGDFAAAARPPSLAAAASRVAAGFASVGGPEQVARPSRRRTKLVGGGRVHRVRGTWTPDHRTRVVELSMPVRPVLALAKAERASLTIYLTALFLEAVRETTSEARPARTMAVSVPVNLRSLFESESARNFFATTRLTYTWPESGGGDLSALCRSLQAQLQEQVTREALEAKLTKLVGFELNPVVRMIPRPLKDVILGTVNRLNNRSITVAISSLGRLVLPDPVDSHVGAVFLQVSAARPQFCALTHGDVLTVSFTSPFLQTAHHRAFARALTSRGVPVTVAVTKVTDSELNRGVT